LHNSFKKGEGHANNTVTKSVDVFSMGIVFFYALTGTNPFHGDSIEDPYDNIVNEDFKINFKKLNKPHHTYSDIILAKQLITSMLQYDESNRPTMKQVMNHPFFWNENKIENFFSAASQYIHGMDSVKDKFNAAYRTSMNGWIKLFEENNNTTITKILCSYKNDASECLRFLRNLVRNIKVIIIYFTYYFF